MGWSVQESFERLEVKAALRNIWMTTMKTEIHPEYVEAQVRCTIECGVDDAISRPFRMADLTLVIERLVLV